MSHCSTFWQALELPSVFLFFSVITNVFSKMSPRHSAHYLIFLGTRWSELADL